MGFLEKPLLAMRGFELYKVMAGINPATDATRALRIS